MDQKASIGRIVRYVPGDGDSFTEERPAIIVKVWNEETGYSNLQVFTDGSNDGSQNVEWRTSIDYSAEPKPRTWHWPART